MAFASAAALVAFASAAALASSSARSLCAICAKANSITRRNASARVRCSCVACVRARAAAAHRHTGSSHECLCDIDVSFGRRFEERPSVFIGQRFSSFIRDSPLLNLITLGPNENDVFLTCRRAVFFNIIFPVTHAASERLLLAWNQDEIYNCSWGGEGCRSLLKVMFLKFLPHQ